MNISTEQSVIDESTLCYIKTDRQRVGLTTHARMHFTHDPFEESMSTSDHLGVVAVGGSDEKTSLTSHVSCGDGGDGLSEHYHSDYLHLPYRASKVYDKRDKKTAT